MEGHPIEGLMKTAMESIKDMVDVNTIVGDAVETPDGTVIIPISKVGFGFASGGGEYNQNDQKFQQDTSSANNELPFAGGAGAGVSVQPVAFMVVGQGQIRLLPVNQNTMVERVIDLAPQIMTEVQNMLNQLTQKNNNQNNSNQQQQQNPNNLQ